MTPLKHSVDIDRSLQEVYSLATQVERYPEFLPGYLESRIIDRRDGHPLLLRKALVEGRVHEWQSWVQFQPDQAIRFEHAAGPLQGTKVLWSFTSLSPQKTRLVIHHYVKVSRPWLVGRILEKCFFVPRVNRMAGQVVEAFKKACEKGFGR